MAMIKESLALTLAAAVAAVGVHAVLVPRAPAPVTVRAEPSAPSASLAGPGEMMQALGQLREAFAAAKGASPGEVPPPPVAESQPAPLPRVETDPARPPAGEPGPSTAAVQANPDAAAGPSDKAPEPEAHDPSWVPTPRPDLIAKADALLDNGDVAGARFWFEEALALGDADAAFRLAETYDPQVLAEWKVIGIASDVGRARALYERAMHGGVDEAGPRLAQLAR